MKENVEDVKSAIINFLDEGEFKVILTRLEEPGTYFEQELITSETLMLLVKNHTRLKEMNERLIDVELEHSMCIATRIGKTYIRPDIKPDPEDL